MHNLNTRHNNKTGNYIDKNFGMTKVSINKTTFNFTHNSEYYKNLVKKNKDFFKDKNIFKDKSLEDISFKIADIDCIFSADSGYLIKSIDFEIKLDKSKIDNTNRQIGFISDYSNTNDNLLDIFADRYSSYSIKDRFTFPTPVEIATIAIFREFIETAQITFYLVKEEKKIDIKSENLYSNETKHRTLHLTMNNDTQFIFFTEYNEPLPYGIFKNEIIKYTNFAIMLPEIISANLQENDNIKMIDRSALDLILQTQEFDKIFGNKEISKKLGIDFFLRGSFMNISDTFVITVNIIDALTGKLEHSLNSNGLTLNKLLSDINIKISNYFNNLIIKTEPDSTTVLSSESNKDLELSDFFLLKD